MLRDDGNEHHLSAASRWEIAIKRRLGKLKLTHELGALPELLDGLGIRIVPVDERHALDCREPEPMTRDPFDRMLLAQCQNRGIAALTIDRGACFASAGGEGIGSISLAANGPAGAIRGENRPPDPRPM